MSDTKKLTLEDVQEAVAGTGAAFRCRRRLQPAGGEGDKVFPPTYAGAVYATENRRVKTGGQNDAETFETVRCVLLDSVQSQANRMEAALQEGLDAKRVTIPVIEVDFSPFHPGDDKEEKLRLIDPIGKVTSLQVPHRVADAILRESQDKVGEQPFRETPQGKLIDSARTTNATPLYTICPTALIFGTWDSTGPKGGLGAKFERALTSEIVGINATFGSRTQSRIDPVIAKNPELYSKSGSWTAEEAEADKDAQGKAIRFGKKLSELNFGNVTPDYARYDAKAITLENRQTIDPMRSDGSHIEANRVRPGGVTVDYAEQTTVLSLAALRRLRFPAEGKSWEASEEQRARDRAARTVLAALALCAAELATEAGLDLRSRCLLWPEQTGTWELLDSPGGQPKQFALDPESAVKILNEAVEAAGKVNVKWKSEPIELAPSDRLVKLVRRSQELAAQGAQA